MKIKVLVVDDHQLFRQGLINLLKNAEDIEVIGEAEDGVDAIEKAAQLKPNVILLDIAMKNKNGIEASKILKQEMPEIKILAVSMHSDSQYVKGMLEAGVDGYLLKNCTCPQLTQAIYAVHSGKKYLSEDITQIVIDGYLHSKPEVADNFALLSVREKEVFMLLAEGKSTREVAEELFISTKTVGSHKQNLCEKLELKNNSEIIKYAIKNELIVLD